MDLNMKAVKGEKILFDDVADAFDSLMNALFSSPEKMIYVKPSGFFDKRVNAENIIALASGGYKAFTSNSEYFGLTPEKAHAIEFYLDMDENYDVVVELHAKYPKMDSEHGSFMRIVNRKRMVFGSNPLDKNGRIMDEDSEEYKKIFGV